MVKFLKHWIRAILPGVAVAIPAIVASPGFRNFLEHHSLIATIYAIVTPGIIAIIHHREMNSMESHEQLK